MTHTTEQERAEFEKLWAERPIYMGQDHQKELALHWWQAARSAPSMPDQSIIEAVDGWFARNTALGGCSDKDVAELAAIFAAAPQPTEALPAFQTEAAPVQLPESISKVLEDCRSRAIDYATCPSPYNNTRMETAFQYLEHQVRQLLAAHAHGITQAKLGGK